MSPVTFAPAKATNTNTDKLIPTRPITPPSEQHTPEKRSDIKVPVMNITGQEIPEQAVDGDSTNNNHDNNRRGAGAGTDGSPTARRITHGRALSTKVDSTIFHPGSVTINVKGAFIVEEEDNHAPVTGLSGSSPTTTATATTEAGAGGHGAAITSRSSSPGSYRGSSPHGSRTSPRRGNTREIRLPNHTAVVSHVAVDIGGSLAKVVYFSREPHSTEPGGRLGFLSFETERIDECIDFLRTLKDEKERQHRQAFLAADGLIASGSPTSKPPPLCVMATGGGAYKFYAKIKNALGGVDVLREDEMECLIIGLDFFITEIPREVFTYSETDPMHFASPATAGAVYPYLLVNIGSGVSFLKVSGPRTFDRVGGTSLGGGTLWGLLSLLTGARSFDDMLDLAEKGDNANVDMLVGDIYGTDYGKIGLKNTTIASSFGKVFRKKRQAEREAEDTGGMTDQFLFERLQMSKPKPAEHNNNNNNNINNNNNNINNNNNNNINNNNNNNNDHLADSEVTSFTEKLDADSTTKKTALGSSQQPQPQHTPLETSSELQRHPGDLINQNRVADKSVKDGQPCFSPEDISVSLLYAISNNIGQIAFLQSQIHELNHIYFGGSFIRGHPQTMNTLSYAIRFWSQGRKQAYFLRHEGYLGAVGAFLKRQPENWGRSGSFS